mmetsp:Transcript_23729/g.38430  ORF Transcript_23729/g.38430 Transcript_23729/m.38430 type:complete len:86 (-) Transcript_23729:29-286(-)
MGSILLYTSLSSPGDPLDTSSSSLRQLLRGAAHDVMLGPGWKAGAERLGRWLEGPALRRRRREKAQEGGGKGGGGGAAPPPSTGR